MPQEPILVVLSSTALGKSACTLNLWRTVIDGYREQFMSSRIIYGIAVHKFIDKMYKTGGKVPEAIQAAKKAFSLPKLDDPKSMHLSDEGHMIATCINLWTSFIEEESEFELLQVDGKPLTEVTYGPYTVYEDEVIKVVIEGTLDKIGKFRDGCYAIGDWKTTSTWDTKKYFSQYELTRQLRLYRLACILESRISPDSVLGKIGKGTMGAFIDAIFLKPDRNEMTVKRSEVYQYDAKEMEAFEDMLFRYCIRLSGEVKSRKQLDRQGILNGSCEGKWGKCSFWNVCGAPEHVRQLLLDRDFDKVPWNPHDYNNLQDEV